MQPGKLIHPVDIETYTDSVSSSGETVKTWTKFASVMADIVPVSGREFLQADKVHGEISHRIYIWHLPGLLGKMRINDGSRIFQIVAIIPDRTNNTMMTVYANQKA